jgi:basic membrane protein A
MKKHLVLISMVILGGMLLAACGGAAAEPAAEEAVVEEAAAEEPLKVVHLINGTLGDKSFIDSSHRGLVQASEEFGFELITSEAGSDPAKWEPAFMDAVQDPTVDFIVLGSGDLLEILLETAPEYPEKKFIMFDNPIPFDEGDYDNIYAVLYLQNEGSYLAGLYAGLMSETGIVGAVGGMDIPVINDFMVGYVQGAGDAGIPEENVLIQYAGSWGDPAKGKELALTMYQQGADIIFQVAGGPGEGVFYAAEEAGKWAIGVDSDQALIIEETNPDQAARILTSMLKNVDKSLYRAFKLYFEGNLAFGTNENLGIPDGVGLAYNKYYEENTPQEVKDKIAEAEAAVLNGDIVIDTVFE